MGGTSSSLQARGITEIKVREGVRWGWPCFQCTPTCVCLCVCVCKTGYSLGYYYHNPTYVFSPVYMISNVFSIAVYVSLDIKMLYSKICQYEGVQASDFMSKVLYFPLYLPHLRTSIFQEGTIN